MLMQPRPRAETSRFCPRVRFCIVFPWRGAPFSSLAVYETLKLGRIPVPTDINRRDGIMNGLQIFRSQFYARATEILFEAVKLRSSWDRHNPRLLGEQPRQRNLRLGRLLLFCNPAQLIHHRLVCLSRFDGKTWNDITKVCLFELCLIGDCASQETLAERAERNETDAKFFQGRKDFRFWLSPPERILALQRGYRLYCMSPANARRACFRHTEMSNLALLDEVLHGARDILDWDVRVDAMLIEQVD